MRTQKITISVIGGHECNETTAELAKKVGKIIAEAGAVLVCGGLEGVMQFAAQGCQEAGGLTIGLLPGKEKSDANPYIDIAIPTTIGFARNAMVASSADIIIALPGSYGTLCEICYANVYKRPVIDLGNWNQPGLIQVENSDDLKELVNELIQKIKFL